MARTGTGTGTWRALRTPFRGIMLAGIMHTPIVVNNAVIGPIILTPCPYDPINAAIGEVPAHLPVMSTAAVHHHHHALAPHMYIHTHA